MDTRIHTYGSIFGKVSDVAQQYGIKIAKLRNCYQFSAPRTRLQIFAEKLHFSRIPFSNSPF